MKVVVTSTVSVERSIQARNQGGAQGAFAPPPPSTGPKGPDFETRYPSLGVQSVK